MGYRPQPRAPHKGFTQRWVEARMEGLVEPGPPPPGYVRAPTPEHPRRVITERAARNMQRIARLNELTDKLHKDEEAVKKTEFRDQLLSALRNAATQTGEASEAIHEGLADLRERREAMRNSLQQVMWNSSRLSYLQVVDEGETDD